MRQASNHAIIYLHGFPGGPNELSLFGPEPEWATQALNPDRAMDRPDLPASAYFDELAGRVSGHANGRLLHLVGFSLGARVAMELALRLGGQVGKLDLISPAGPLDGNNHLSMMAGKAVFAMAGKRPRAFAILTTAQAWIARKQPALLYRGLFGSAGEPGMDVLGFRERATALLQGTFDNGSVGYRREVLAYVAPWSDVPRMIKAPTTIWQGSLDNWTPPAMAANLQAMISMSNLRPVPGRGHYGTLQHALANLQV